MTNEQKASQICDIVVAVDKDEICREDVEDALLYMAEWKDEQSILELGGWHKEEPTEDGWYLIKSNDFPKNCECMVAEWDNDAKHFYSEASDFPVSYKEWKLIERR